MKKIDNGNAFDLGLAAEDYAKYRDIYPEEFYNKIYELGFYRKFQRVLDMGTGSGVLPRNMYKYGSDITAADISENQIKYAEILSENMGIKYLTGSDLNLKFDDNTFDCINDCQSYFYFNHDIFAEKASRWLNPNGKLGMFYMGWLPEEDRIAQMSENLIRKYNPDWSGYGDYRHKIKLPEIYDDYFKTECSEIFDVRVPFTRESWNGRIKACRGIGASLSKNLIKEFENEHMEMLRKNAEEKFSVLHYCAVLSLKNRK